MIYETLIIIFLFLKQTYEEAEKGFEEVTSREKGLNRDDRVHGSLLIVNELIRNSSMEGEVGYQSKVDINFLF